MRHRTAAAPVVLTFLLALPAGAASITGVCPDGSIFIVQNRDQVPCDAAKEVAPGEVPPVRPEYLPRPYSWQVYRERANPNNPYNLIDSARRVREMEGGLPPSGSASAPEAGAEAPIGTTNLAPRSFGTAGSAPSPVPGPPDWGTAPGVPDPVALTLGPEEVRDLFLIVELSQQAAPGRFLKEDARGEPTLEVSFAWSAAFETRIHEALSVRGPVLIFTVLAHGEDAFHPNFTFVQGHESFRPSPEMSAQMGVLEGRPGVLAAEEVVLGYVVLPDRMDPGQALDVYWNDRRIESVLRP